MPISILYDELIYYPQGVDFIYNPIKNFTYYEFITIVSNIAAYIFLATYTLVTKQFHDVAVEAASSVSLTFHIK